MELSRENILELVFHYHTLSKHSFHAYAPGPGYMDWANQPNPFRRYSEVNTLPLSLISAEESPEYDRAYILGEVSPAPLNARFLSQLFQDSLGLSAWKCYGDSTWALRMNPSSGNLHPTEGYLISGPIDGLDSHPFIAHYAPKEHLLEVRTEFSENHWNSLFGNLGRNAIVIGLSSIPWREAWKYGERAFRYCHHDLGHAIASVAIAASGLGWVTLLIDEFETERIQNLLNLNHSPEVEPEFADCLLLLTAANGNGDVTRPNLTSLLKVDQFEYQGKANRLSQALVSWPWVEKMCLVTQKPECRRPNIDSLPDIKLSIRHRKTPLRKIIHQRRSAVQMDGSGTMERDDFYSILERLLPQIKRCPFNVLDWDPLVHFVMFIHRVNGIEPGIYFLIRNLKDGRALKEKCRPEFLWGQPESCPTHIPFFKLVGGDVRREACAVSCGQEIAADGCFSLGMITRFREPLEKEGPWMYPRFYWECGLVGQVLYLEAEAVGIRSTGIGCFFDDAVHQILGIQDASFQSLYHFTVGHPVEDTRLITLPPYSEELSVQKGFGASQRS